LTLQDLSRFLEIGQIPVQKKGLTERTLDDKVLFVNELPVDFWTGSALIPYRTEWPFWNQPKLVLAADPDRFC
jgi:hypothetical protein